MRRAELIQLGVLAYFAVLAWLLPLRLRRRILLTALLVALLVLLLGLPSLGRPGSLTLSVVRDWLPAPLMLVTYWLAGLLFVSPNLRLQAALARLDRLIFQMGRTARPPLHAAIANFLELSYMLCYATVPLGLATLYLLHLGRYSDAYWSLILPPAYLCYAAVPLLQTLPPRLDPGDPLARPRPSRLRQINLWILEHGGIRANTFPSAHVAASGAVGLAMAHFVPALGAVFLGMAVAIAAGAVYGRYHYATDALLGGALALLSHVVQ